MLCFINNEMIEIVRNKEDRYSVLFDGKPLVLPPAITYIYGVNKRYNRYTLQLVDPVYRNGNEKYTKIYNKAKRKFHLFLGENDNIYGYSIEFKLAPNSIIRDKQNKIIAHNNLIETVKNTWISLDKIRRY